MEVKTISKTTPFGKPFKVIGYFLIVTAIAFIFIAIKTYFTNKDLNLFFLFLFVFPFLLFFGLLFSFSESGLIINLTKQTIYTFIKVLNIKSGTTNSLETYSNTTILSKRMASKTNSASNYIGHSDHTSNWHTKETVDKSIKHDVVLLKQNHRQKLLINRFDTFSEAKEFAVMIADYTQKPLVKYNPKRISKRK